MVKEERRGLEAGSLNQNSPIVTVNQLNPNQHILIE
jgi:hypothetical protein